MKIKNGSYHWHLKILQRKMESVLRHSMWRTLFELVNNKCVHCWLSSAKHRYTNWHTKQQLSFHRDCLALGFVAVKHYWKLLWCQCELKIKLLIMKIITILSYRNSQCSATHSYMLWHWTTALMVLQFHCFQDCTLPFQQEFYWIDFLNAESDILSVQRYDPKLILYYNNLLRITILSGPCKACPSYKIEKHFKNSLVKK